MLPPSAVGWPTRKEKVPICEIVKKGKFYYLEQILKTTETGKVLTCESERSKQLKSESFTLGTDQYKNIPLSSVTTVSSNHANVSP